MLAGTLNACSSDPPGSVTTTDDGVAPGPTTDVADAGGDPGATPPPMPAPSPQMPPVGQPQEEEAEPVITGIEISPLDITVTAADGATPTVQFETVAIYDDGTRAAALGPRYEVDLLALGLIDEASGIFTANGLAGGTTNVRVVVPGAMEDWSVETTLTVRVERTAVPDGLDPAAAAQPFDSPVVDAADRATTLLYPLNGAIMPQNVFPADIQWDGGVEGDMYRVVLAKPEVEVTAYVPHSGAAFQYHYLPETDDWRSLAQSQPHEPATIRVDRFDSVANEVIEGTPVQVTFASAALNGSIYYWDIGAARIKRIDDGTNNAVSFMPAPRTNCVGCHSVSRSGRYMVGRLGAGYNIAGVFDLTQDLSGNAPSGQYSLDDSPPRWWFSTWNADDTRIAVTTNASNFRLALFDPMSGVEVPVTGTMPTNVTHPEWSPNGSNIAYVADANNWGGLNVSGNIAALPVTAPDTVGAVQVLHNGTDLSGAVEGGNADSYPTWSPDSARIAFAHGTSSRSENGLSALYAMAANGEELVRLDTAVGVDGTDSFQPRFSPFQQGGFYWLSFLSKRTYGNEHVGNRGANPGCRGNTGVSTQQIWVTAVRVDAQPGEDPSSVPYWLPGQQPRTCNISAFWAPRACRPDGEACTANAECCGGDCRPNAEGELVCAPPPEDRCRVENETCSTGADCCPPGDDGDVALECIDRVCTVPPPVCLARDEACEESADCCAPYQCVAGSCGIPIQ